LVPCHRIVGADGGMTGFSGPGGIRTKTRLLALEGALLLSE
jgi:methylated-DNA-[protein]-cysteine S-methyltransferase